MFKAYKYRLYPSENQIINLNRHFGACRLIWRQMQYKCDWYGKNLIKIGRFEPSSKTCSNCRSVNENLALKDREWVCANCGTTHDRDLNAAINIKRMGLEKHSGEGISGEPVESRRLRWAKKQEKAKKPAVIAKDRYDF